MTVQSEVSRIQYTGTGSVTNYAVPFYFLEDSHLIVIVTDSDGVSTTLTPYTDYTISGAGVQAGGSVRPLVAVSSSSTVTVTRSPDSLQLVDYVQGGPIPAEELEAALDKLTMLAQRASLRKIELAEMEPSTTSIRLPLKEEGKVLGWGSSGFENLEYTGLGFISSRSTTSPNDTVNASVLQVVADSSNADLVLSPKGSGAILARLPDGGSTGGNKRGTNSVDLQSAFPQTATKVASGNFSTICGGVGNTASGTYSTVGGGISNTATGINSSIGGGISNTANGGSATVAGGQGNTTNAASTTIGGGTDNTASAVDATVGGGHANTASNLSSTVAGGSSNTASGQYSTVAGGYTNAASGNRSAVGGGFSNTASAVDATVGGGYTNTASGERSTVGGGETNTASGARSTVAGGYTNTASGSGSAVGGGDINIASGGLSTIGGGSTNAASGTYSTVGGGNSNRTSGLFSTIAGGYSNTASGNKSAVGGGFSNTADGESSTVGGGETNTASGQYSTVGGGFSNTASGARSSIPGGHGAKADHYGELAFANGSFDAAVGSCQHCEFILRAETSSTSDTELLLGDLSQFEILEDGVGYSFDCHLTGLTEAGKIGDMLYTSKASRMSGVTTVYPGAVIQNWNAPTGFQNGPVHTVTTSGTKVVFNLTPSYTIRTRWILRVEANKLKI